MSKKKSLIIFPLILSFALIQACSTETTSNSEDIFSSSSISSEQVKSSSLEEHTHQLKKVEAKKSSCSLQGNEEYYTCEICNAIFSDPFGENTLEGIPYLPYVEHEYRYEVLDEFVHKKICKTCGYSEEEEHRNNKVNASTAGVGHFEAETCAICNNVTKYVTSVPEIKIYTNNGKDIKGDRMSAEYYESTVSVENCDSEYAFNRLPGKVRVRGNYTANNDKKPYKIKFDSKQKMLGMNNDAEVKDWVLLPDWKDLSMTRTLTAFYLSSLVYQKDKLYSSDYRYVKVYVNNKYKGLYGLAEEQEINKERVKITKPEETDLTDKIGYLVELDYNWNLTEDTTNTFTYDYLQKDLKFLNDNSTCSYTRFEDGYTIKSNFYSDAQKTFISNRIAATYEAMYDAIYTTNGSSLGYYRIDENNNLIRDKSILNSYDCINNIVNIPSIVDTFIINEIMCDMDYAHASFYLSFDNGKKGDKKLTLQAPWDWDSSLGFHYPHYDRFLCCDSIPKGAPSGNISKQTNPWLMVLTGAHWFWELLDAKFKELKQENVFNRVLNRIDKAFELYKDLIYEDLDLWPKRESSSSSGAYSAYKNLSRGQPHIDYVKTFITNRVNFLETNIPLRMQKI